MINRGLRFILYSEYIHIILCDIWNSMDVSIASIYVVTLLNPCGHLLTGKIVYDVSGVFMTGRGIMRIDMSLEPILH